MKEQIVEYKGEKYRYRNGRWYDSSNLAVTTAMSMTLNHILNGGKKRQTVEVKVASRVEVQISNKKENDKKIIEQNRKMVEQRIIFQEQLFDFDRSKYYAAGLSDRDHYNTLRTVEDYWKKKDYYMAYKSIKKNQLDIANILGQIEPPKVKNYEGVNYIYNYIPKRGIEKASEFEKAIVNRVYSLKDCMFHPAEMESVAAIKNVAADLWLALKHDNPNVERFHLTCVQPSMAGKKAPLSICIEFMCRYGVGMFINDSDLIKRDKSVARAHSTKDRPSYQMQRESISCTKKINVATNEKVVILDDIVTTGTQLRACKDLLLSNGIKESSIILMTYAKTLNKGFD